ncbi:MAG TPA: hypothetical protein VF812_11110 [Ktedonobacterales bacterium]
MRWSFERVWHSDWRTIRRVRTAQASLLAMLAMLALVVSACGTSTPNLPSGVYTSQQYHFSVTYPAGWQVNASSQPNAEAPLIIIITRSGTRQNPGSQISSLTVDVLDLSNPSISQTAAALSKNRSLSKITIGGQLGYRDKPVQETGGGADASATMTHSDYYVAYGRYLYQISTDALAGDGPALDTMAQSFKILN